jgi:competence protein ComGC
MKKFQKGFTLVEMLIVGWGCVCVGFVVAVVCIAIHFINKFW